VYNQANGPVTLKIPASAITSSAGKTGGKFFLARWMRGLARFAETAWAGSTTREPPMPPGFDGSNAGTSSDSIGVGVASGGNGLCFIKTAAKQAAAPPGMAVAGLVFAFVCAWAVRRRMRS
jgi:hypothetical protein